jgi:hypothetical protein
VVGGKLARLSQFGFSRLILGVKTRIICPKSPPPDPQVSHPCRLAVARHDQPAAVAGGQAHIHHLDRRELFQHRLETQPRRRRFQMFSQRGHLHHAEVAVQLAILPTFVLPQEHQRQLSHRHTRQFKRAGLHHTAGHTGIGPGMQQSRKSRTHHVHFLLKLRKSGYPGRSFHLPGAGIAGNSPYGLPAASFFLALAIAAFTSAVFCRAWALVNVSSAFCQSPALPAALPSTISDA